MDVREEILDYINRNELTGALLLTGPWGCGKTYLVKEIAKELNNGKKVAVSTISLFGIDSVAVLGAGKETLGAKGVDIKRCRYKKIV